MGMLQSLKQQFARKSAKKDIVFTLYNQLVDAARAPVLYQKFHIPDTLDGRFDSIVLHLSLFITATDGKTSADDALAGLSRDLVSVFLKDMDRNLREIGVGDLSVGKQVKKMGTAFLGRTDAYGKALAGRNPAATMAKALKRNLYRGRAVKQAALGGMAGYALRVHKSLKTMSLDDIEAGRLPAAVFKV